MLKQLMTIAVAAGLILPGSAVLAEMTREQAEEQTRTEKQEMLQKGAPAAGAQEQVQGRSRTREEMQTRERTGEAAMEQKQYQKRSGQALETAEITASGDQMKDRDRDLVRDKDKLHDRDSVQDRDRIHDPAGSAHRAGSGRR